MSRWSIANYAGPISLEQFQVLVCEFETLIEQSFATAVIIEVRAMKRIKATSHYLHDDWIMDGIAQENRDNTFYTTTNVMAVDKGVFESAAYIEVNFHPFNPSFAPSSAWAHCEFKGKLPNQATFYVQPDDQSVARAMKEKHQDLLFGDGYKANS
ncbi:MAG: hypothetical protein SFV17_05310 [Candidatus Obscuribacter sp.]|nr:hypothetical protein [Candidatus Obscuribacter sp.]